MGFSCKPTQSISHRIKRIKSPVIIGTLHREMWTEKQALKCLLPMAALWSRRVLVKRIITIYCAGGLTATRTQLICQLAIGYILMRKPENAFSTHPELTSHKEKTP